LTKDDPPFEPKPRRPILDELVLTVLSQATSDVNSGRAFEGLKGRFATWDEVSVAPVEEVASAIRAGGIADVKARRIQDILHAIEAREGSLELGRLNTLPDEEVEEYLDSLPGVGPKTVACVLLFCMQRDAFPVDTHVHRVGKRLGIIAPNVTAEAAHRTLGRDVPPDIRYEFHMALIRHGRTICKARAPRCTECVLFDLCEAGPRLLAAGEAR